MITTPTGPAYLQGHTTGYAACAEINSAQLLCLQRQGAVSQVIQLCWVSEEDELYSPTPHNIQQVLDQFEDLFQEPTSLPPRRACDHYIPLMPGAQPGNIRPYRHKPEHKSEIERQVKEMLKEGVIQKSHNPFSSPVILVRKKDDSWRLCIDYCHLNAMTIVRKYPVPVIEELLDELHGAKWFSKLDLRAGYHQIRLAEGEEFKTAFQTHSGHFEFRVVSFGLARAPRTFFGAMNGTHEPLLRVCVLVFLDDILVFSKTLLEHVEHLRQVPTLLRRDQWKVKRSKCAFGQQHIPYLGHVTSGEGVDTDPAKVSTVANWSSRTNVKEVRQFLGLAGYYRRFVRQFGVIAWPLFNQLKKGVPFVWTDNTEQSFQALKQSLISVRVLALPDFKKPFVVETDACDAGIGVILQQDGHPIAFMSRALSPKHRGLSTYEKEYLVVIAAVDQWRPYLQSEEFIIKTDHRSLIHLGEQRLATPWQQRAFTKLLGLQYRIVYKKGVENGAADALSRSLPAETLMGVTSCQPTWLEDIIASYNSNQQSERLLEQLVIRPNLKGRFSLVQGLVRFRGRIWLGGSTTMQQQIIAAFHDSLVRGHSGFPVTYKRVRKLFAWPKMKTHIRQYVSCCQTCQQAKPERVAYPGMLQPLPVPRESWELISLDFIDGLPHSGLSNCILFLVDKFTKFAHFLPVTHPYTTSKIALLYMTRIYPLHGFAGAIVSDRDPVFTSNFWLELFKYVGTELKMSTAHHLQTDG